MQTIEITTKMDVIECFGCLSTNVHFKNSNLVYDKSQKCFFLIFIAFLIHKTLTVLPRGKSFFRNYFWQLFENVFSSKQFKSTKFQPIRRNLSIILMLLMAKPSKAWCAFEAVYFDDEIGRRVPILFFFIRFILFFFYSKFYTQEIHPLRNTSRTRRDETKFVLHICFFLCLIVVNRCNM